MALNEIVLNYLFIQASILLFLSPFLLVYFFSYPELKFRHILFNKFAEDFLASKYANWLIFLWAAAEATVWFVIPEFLLLLIIFLKIKNKKKLLVYDFLGTILGTVIGLIIFFTFKIDLAKVPYVTEGMIRQVDFWYKNLGILALIHQPFSGIPYKVFLYSASKFSFFLPIFFTFAIVIRMTRYYILYFIFDGLYPFFHRFISKKYTYIFFLSCLIFSIMLLKIVLSYGSLFKAY